MAAPIPYDPNPRPLSQQELDALAAQQQQMGGQVPAGGYQAQPPPQHASAPATYQTDASTSNGGTYQAAPPQPTAAPVVDQSSPSADPSTAPAGPPVYQAGAPPSPGLGGVPTLAPPPGRVTQATDALGGFVAERVPAPIRGVLDAAGGSADLSGFVPPVGQVGDALARGDLGGALGAAGGYLARPTAYETARQGERVARGQGAPGLNEIVADPSRLYDVVPTAWNTWGPGSLIAGESLDTWAHQHPDTARQAYEQGGGQGTYEAWLADSGITRTPPWEGGDTGSFLRGLAVDLGNDPALLAQAATGGLSTGAKLAGRVAGAGRTGRGIAGAARAADAVPTTATRDTVETAADRVARSAADTASGGVADVVEATDSTLGATAADAGPLYRAGRLYTTDGAYWQGVERHGVPVARASADGRSLVPLTRGERSAWYPDLIGQRAKEAGILGAGGFGAWVGAYNIAEKSGHPLSGWWGPGEQPAQTPSDATGGTTGGTTSGAVLSGSAPATPAMPVPSSAPATESGGTISTSPANGLDRGHERPVGAVREPSQRTGTAAADPVVISEPFHADDFVGVAVPYQGRSVTVDAPRADRMARIANTLTKQRRRRGSTGELSVRGISTHHVAGAVSLPAGSLHRGNLPHRRGAVDITKGTISRGQSR